MDQPRSLSSKRIDLSIDDADALREVAHALSSQVRLDILRLVDRRGMNVNELARELGLPLSTAALNVQVLERAGLVACERQPGSRGTMKICSRRLDWVHVGLAPARPPEAGVGRVELSVGCYSEADGIAPTCGMAGRDRSFEMDDNPLAFYHPLHFEAQLIWFRAGSVEYRFPTLPLMGLKLDYLEFSFEACAEAPGYANDWPSDIACSLEGLPLGVFRCPGDFGGRKGLLNPPWWSLHNTQYGLLKTFRVTPLGSYLEGDYAAPTALNDLRIEEKPCLRLRVGVAADAARPGGVFH